MLSPRRYSFALELAAARVWSLTAEQIAARLDDYLSLLTDGSRMAQSRQRTLRATLDWSYALLSLRDQRLLECTSAFSGRWTLEAAEAVCAETAAEAAQVLDGLASLVDKSLVTFDEQGQYRLLEMVRQYAAERLAERGREYSVRGRHRDWYLKAVEEADLSDPEQDTSLRRLERDHDNLRAALAWCEQDAYGAQTGLRLAGALGLFWSMRGYYEEGRTYLARALAREDAHGATAARGLALKGAGILADRQGDYASARTLHEQSRSIYRELGDRQGIGSTLGHLNAVAQHQGDTAAAQAYYEEAQAHYELGVRLYRELGEKKLAVIELNNLGVLEINHKDYAAAQRHHEQCLLLLRELGDRKRIPGALNNLGVLAFERGDYASAQTLYEQSLDIYRKLADQDRIAGELNNLGVLAYMQGDHATAQTMQQESLDIYRAQGDKNGVLRTLHHLAWAVCDQGNYASAGELLEESLLLGKELGDRVGLADSLEGMAALTLA